MAFLAYAFQIYFDFSGYSDMAIGLGRMFGFHFLENFNYPYTATSVTDFWRRWHISLSSFFRDYVYIPLGGNRVSTPRWVVNLMVVWGLTGLWHGASWNFGFWGCYYGILLIGERLLWGRMLQRLPTVFQHVYAMMAVLLGWVFFRVEGFSAPVDWIIALFGGYGLGNLATLECAWGAAPVALVDRGGDCFHAVAASLGPARDRGAPERGRPCLLGHLHFGLVNPGAGDRRFQPVHLFPLLILRLPHASLHPFRLGPNCGYACDSELRPYGAEKRCRPEAGRSIIAREG